MLKRMVLIATLALGGCTTAQVTSFIGQVQADAAIACKFVPTVATILAFFNAGIGATVATVTAAICAAVPQPSSSKWLALPRYGAGGPPVYTGNVGNIPIIGWRTQ
jgi:hypothetical protein